MFLTELRLIHAEQVPLYNFIVLRKYIQETQLKTKQVKRDILNQWEYVGFPKLNNCCASVQNVTWSKAGLKM